MLKVKLFPKGKKHQRSFRLVIAEARSKINGRFIDDLGFWTPQSNKLQFNQEKLDLWLRRGAQLTLGVDRLLHPDKFSPKTKKIKKDKNPPADKTPVNPPKTPPPNKE